MKREFVINILLLFVINLLIKPLYIFGVEAAIQDSVGTEAYGLYFFYFNFVFLFQFINDPGIQNWNAQFVPKNRDIVSTHFVSLFQIKFLLAFIFLGLTSLTAYILGYHQLEIVFFISLNFILSSLFMLFRGIVAGLGFYRTDSLLSSLDKMLMIIILGYLIWFSDYKDQFDIKYLIYGQAISYLIATLIAYGIITIKIKPVFNIVKLTEFVKVLKASAPFVLIMLFMTTYNKMDGVMLGWLLNDNNYQTGVYAAAYRFYDAANMVGYLFAALLLPMFASKIDEKKILKELLDTGVRYTSALSLVVLAVVFFFGDEILKLLYSQYQPQFFESMRLLLMSYFMVSVAYIYGSLLVATGKVNNLNLLFGIGLIINIILCLTLIPEYKAVGASIATFITQTFVMSGQIYLVRKQMDITIAGSELLKLVFFSMSILGTFLVFTSLLNIEWYLILSLCILICVLLSFIFKIIDKKDLAIILSGK